MFVLEFRQHLSDFTGFEFTSQSMESHSKLKVEFPHGKFRNNVMKHIDDKGYFWSLFFVRAKALKNLGEMELVILATWS